MDYNNEDKFLRTLCGNREIYRQIIRWLENFDFHSTLTEKSCIIVTGNSGIGKTYSMNQIAIHLKYFVTHIDSNNCYTSQQLRDIIFKSITSSLIQTLTNSVQKKLIIIDNFDSMFMADKTMNTTLLKILGEKKLKNIPIVCITNIDILRKMGDIKKTCKVFELIDPSKTEINSVLKPKKSEILLYKSIDRNIDIIQLYGNHFDKDKFRRIIESEIWLIPLRFHENIIQELNNRSISNNKKKQFYKLFIESLCLYDCYMSKNYIEIALEIFICTIYFLSILSKKRSALSSMDNFTKILSYLSLQKKYNKQYYNSDFPLYQIGNYHTYLLSRKFIYFN
jgi:nucleoside-triphosphatase THEP1